MSPHEMCWNSESSGLLYHGAAGRIKKKVAWMLKVGLKQQKLLYDGVRHGLKQQFGCWNWD